MDSGRLFCWRRYIGRYCECCCNSVKNPTLEKDYLLSPWQHTSASSDGVVTATRSVRTEKPVGQQCAGTTTCPQAQVSPTLCRSVSETTGCSHGDWQARAGNSASEPRGKAGAEARSPCSLAACSSWLPRSLNFTNGWTAKEVLCKSTLQWCSFHFLQVRAPNFGYTLFKISWQFLIKVLSKCGSKQSSGLWNP